MRSEKAILAVFLALAVAGCGAQPRERIYAYKKDAGSYQLAGTDKLLLVVPGKTDLKISLRKIGGSENIDEMSVPSQYMDPVHRVGNIIGDKQPEIIAKVATGGAGFRLIQLVTVAVIEDKLVEVGRWKIGTFSVRGGKGERDEVLKGKVAFPEPNKALYTFIQDLLEKQVHSKAVGEQLFIYDEKLKRFKLTKGKVRPAK